jgi:hypothetical protein
MLQAAHGLVRCGACLSIFEADQHFVGIHGQASNDEHEQQGTESVFISAPGDYFSPSEFLKHGDEEGQGEQENDWDQEEILYAKSDIQDSDFDVFDVDPEIDQSPVKEQLTDSNFDVFDAGELAESRPDPSLEEQDHEFDIFDAGEREFRTPVFTPANEPAGGSTSSPRADAPTSGTPGSAPVILPAGPNAASLLARLKNSKDTEVILPPGPDSATLLAALKKANEQAEKNAAGNENQPHVDSEILYDDLDFEPAASVFLDAESIEAADPPGEPEPNTASDSGEAVYNFPASDLEWEETDVDLDAKSFVILPVDPYQPSAFRSETEKMADKSEPRDKPLPTDSNGSAAVPASATGTAKAASPSQDAPLVDSSKEEIRARVMSTSLHEQDESLEQLSEENLRAIRDVDTSLELEHQSRKRRSSRIVLAAIACLLAVSVFALQFFWQRLPVLSQDARFRPWYQSACGLLRCELPPYVNPAEIQTDNLVVRSHPQQEGSLELNAVFRNRAEFPQPFPLIELRFTDLNNTVVASRELPPDEYLPPALRGMPLMPAGAPVQITLELIDPGPEAVNYQLGFKAAPPRPGS